MAGLKVIGTTVCGDATNETIVEEICLRWYQFASFLPIMRVLSDRTADKFSVFAARAIGNVMKRRFMLAGYLNSVIVERGAYLRPMYYTFKATRNYTSKLTEQLMVGDSLLLAPILIPQASHVSIYFPDVFYEFWSGERMEANRQIRHAVIETEIPLFIRQGSIIAVHKFGKLNTIEDTRLSPFALILAYSCNAKLTDCVAAGKLAVNRNVHLTFDANITHVSWHLFVVQ
jgi:alpha-glucosidase (family GH31 glycosyl hydrolase)